MAEEKGKLHYDVDKKGNKLKHAKSLGRLPYHQTPREDTFPSEEDMACEAQLSALGVWERLYFDLSNWRNDEPHMSDYWVPFQPKPGRANDRESVLIYGTEGSHPSDPCGLSQIAKADGSRPKETDFMTPTEAKDKLTCMHEAFDHFDFGRTFLVRLNAGGHYPPHRDHILLSRPTFRLIGFLGDNICSPLRWEVEDRLMTFEPNRLYYVDTRKTHRLWSSEHHSTMVVCNVIKTWDNVMRLLNALHYQG